jgi:hypothetical protein
MSERASRLRGLVAARSVADHEGVTLESVDLEAAAAGPVRARALTGRVEATLANLPADEVGDRREFRRALTVLLQETDRTARRLDRDPGAPLSRADEAVFEAVVKADGTRPSLLVRGDAVPTDHPLAGEWRDTLKNATRPALTRVIRAVGRIEPVHPTARTYFGTGWVVDATAGLVLTNRHVVEAIWRRLPHRMVRDGNRFRIVDGVFVDFAAEAGDARTSRFTVVEATVAAPDGEGYRRLDAAVLRLEAIPGGPAELPAEVPVVADFDGPRGTLESVCVVGFPGAPRYAAGVHDGIDWTWVNATIFGNRYGVKRLAPGVVHQPLEAFAADPRRWVFGHDATTLGGSSGSPVLSWLDEAPGGFGLHFAGASADTNVSHAVASCVDELHRIGVPVAPPAG